MTRGHLLALLAAVAVVLAGCGGEGSTINDQMRQGDQKGYVAGDGTIQVLAPEERETVITLEGTTLEDEAWSSQDHLGEVVVVNVWGSWCGPCVEEAPDLEEVATEFAEAGEPVQFIGVNSRDSVPSALAFQQKYDVSYPSLQDDGGRTRAQLQGLAVATPTTMVLDGQGRLAARVSGPVEASTLRGLVEDVLKSESAR
ncbi:redoxin [Ornithinimicrobium sp. CNJ-824]|uniref:Cytochrome c biogenesis protein ResA n=1 Tax=Kineosphaera limosa NBRC 100340 TaxID=1184609 RepID=K6WX03_9MICO|nr:MULTISPECIES: TlpA disulfide reductase family protein [Micrococcales]NYD99986.1 thiol-disulfide isomerase/thioredoxin [Kineosphaera limosa]OLT22310.1 redoxin [Ornithinimicrobium sp. CNJ-824]OLT40369.1 redoxin [Serinicoccus sp. CNJ-927]GAB96632.1 cytochrome c biogenesis protein ResA [Kineosphaera limosa NBRC 100340]